ncbi:MAG: hypothetical protein MK106_11025 [Mariniblastus sp.]|nr:hypothetical protein [Mariniblastus sp.]
MTGWIAKLLVGSILISGGFLISRLFRLRRRRPKTTPAAHPDVQSIDTASRIEQSAPHEWQVEKSKLLGKLHIFQALSDDLMAHRDQQNERQRELENELNRSRKNLAQLCDERDKLANALKQLASETDHYQKEIERHIDERDDAFAQGYELVERIQAEIQPRLQSLMNQRDTANEQLNRARLELEHVKTEQVQRDEVNREPQANSDSYPRIMKSERRTLGQGKPTSTSESLTSDDPLLGVVFNRPPEFTDDLKKISGIAGVLESRLNEIGIYTYKQIIGWNEIAIAEISKRLAFKDRIERDQWQPQASSLYLDKYGSRAA